MVWFFRLGPILDRFTPEVDANYPPLPPISGKNISLDKNEPASQRQRAMAPSSASSSAG
jgi:hypothetical protein